MFSRDNYKTNCYFVGMSASVFLGRYGAIQIVLLLFINVCILSDSNKDLMSVGSF